MFDYCSDRYKNLINLYGDLNLYLHHNINFLTISQDVISTFDLTNFRSTRYICFVDDLDVIIESSEKFRFILNNSVLTFSAYNISKINGWLDRYVVFNPIFDENEYVSINVGDRSIESFDYDGTQSVTNLFLNDVKFVNINVQLNSTNHLQNRNIFIFTLKCLLSGCIVNTADQYLLSLLGEYTNGRVNKSIFSYDLQSYCSSKILEQYSYIANIDLVDNTIIGIFGNPYDTNPWGPMEP